MNKGFTLIELLVVVLIIGILSSIALPQYTKAVERSRMAEAVQVLGDLATAQSVFYMMHNEFASDRDDLNTRGDINIPGPSGDTWDLEVSEGGVQTMTRHGGMYEGSALQLTVGTDGSITKECIPGEHPDFCTMAETAGYQRRLMIGGWYPDFGDREKKADTIELEKVKVDSSSLEKAKKNYAR